MKKLSVSIFALVMALGSITAQEKKVNTEASSIEWKGYKVTGSHTGTLAIKEGALVFNNDKLSGGEFVVDMTTLTVTDLEGGMKAKLEGHLKSDDFFSVEKNTSSKLVFTIDSAEGKNAYAATGNLTIKGITKPVSFVISVYGSKATASLKIDRTDYDIQYRSGSFIENLGDKAIYDDFDLVVDLEF
ncbi:YceI family protein [Cellulophaga sp. F20128]|uniref:YceI family protein n=1 Tax=Cellulophaga sp. F20128 TaxID=2926413 RepID=UPI001FF2657A|nr:YceI family protein [Cellulophaga sp. F20128]MCK0158409.1 YceI family protein [Cellulophaga sp. F20128]